MKMKGIYTFISGLLSLGVVAQEQTNEINEPFSFYQVEDFRPLSTIIETEFTGHLDVQVGYISEDSYRFGQYNGLNEEGAQANVSGYYRDWNVENELVDYWQLSGKNIGLDTGNAQVKFGAINHFKFAIELDQQMQCKNNSGITPFTTDGNILSLPNNWVAGQNTTEMTGLNDLTQSFNQSLERSALQIDYMQQFDKNWNFDSSYKLENKKGNQSMSGAFYANASNGHASILSAPIDYKTQTLDFSVGYHQNNYNVLTSYLYSKFDNEHNSLIWQNPYSSNLGAGTMHPQAFGQMSLAPSNDFHQFRIMGNYVFNSSLRFTGDASYSIAAQNDNLLPYSNNSEVLQSPLPQDSFDGSVNTTTIKASLTYQALRKLLIKATSRYEDRANQSNRMGYQSVFGDTWAPQESKYQVYNSPHSRSLIHHELEGTYRLPKASKLSLVIAYEEIDRYNHAVDTTKENIIKLKLRSRAIADLNTRIELSYKDRAASIYQWDQSYFSLFDRQLINETPDNQRFTNHPSLSQYYLSNREQTLAKANFSYYISDKWQANADLHYQANDYDKSALGLTEDQMSHATISAAWLHSAHFDMSFYASYDKYQLEQAGRAFRGGFEKNPFEIYSPLPQASDASRNWYLSPEDTTHSIGLMANWTLIPKKLVMDWDYRLIDSTSKNDEMGNGGALDLDNLGLPEVISKEHHLSFNTLYHFNERTTFKVNYQYYQYKGVDWAYDQVSNMTLDKVLGSGESLADDQVHILQLSVIYRIK